jgi:hypothetical protein
MVRSDSSTADFFDLIANRSCLPQEFIRGHVPRSIEGPDGIIGDSAVEIPKDSKEYGILCNMIAQPRLSSVSARRCFPANRSLWIFQERTTVCYNLRTRYGNMLFQKGPEARGKRAAGCCVAD